MSRKKWGCVAGRPASGSQVGRLGVVLVEVVADEVAGAGGSAGMGVLSGPGSGCLEGLFQVAFLFGCSLAVCC